MDTFKVAYNLSVQYFGEVQSKLEAIERIISDPTVVRKASIEELNYGRSAIVAVVEKLTRLIDRLEESV